MKQNYIFEYENENEFRKKERSIRKYNMLAYKKLQFTYYPQLRDGDFLGKLVSEKKVTKFKGSNDKIVITFEDKSEMSLSLIREY